MIVANLPHPVDVAVKQPAKQKDRMADPEDRAQDDRIDRFNRKIDGEPAAAAEGAAFVLIKQNIHRARDLRREPHHEDPDQQRASGIGSHDVGGIVTQSERDGGHHQQADPCRRTDEHQDRENQLIAADRRQIWQRDKRPVLHVALAPAQVAAHEFQQRRRIVLPAEILPRKDADVIAGSAHQRRFDLVVTEDMPLRLAFPGERGQLAVLHERLEAQDGIVPPIGPAIALPPRACRSCRSACRDACRTGKSARTGWSTAVRRSSPAGCRAWDRPA